MSFIVVTTRQPVFYHVKTEESLPPVSFIVVTTRQPVFYHVKT